MFNPGPTRDLIEDTLDLLGIWGEPAMTACNESGQGEYKREDFNNRIRLGLPGVITFLIGHSSRARPGISSMVIRIH